VTLLYLGSAWVSGIWLGSKLRLPLVLFSLAAIPLCLLPFMPSHRRCLLLCCLCLLALLGGALRFQMSLPQFNQGQLQFYNDKGVIELLGVVHTEPEIKGNSTMFQLAASEIRTDAGGSNRVKGKAVVVCNRYSGYHYGDVLKITGVLETPAEVNEFDYKSYLAQQGVHSFMSYPQIEVVTTGKGFKPLLWIYSVRKHLSQNLSRALPEPQASLAQAILLGLRNNIPQCIDEAFSRTGTAHLLAISGLHLSIIIGIVTSASIWLFGRHRYIYIWLALMTIWIYALITAVRPPIVRGAIMGSLFLIAEYLGRPGSAITALAFAAAAMTGLNPQILWNASFQLSFLAMTGLVILAPYFQTFGRGKLSIPANKSRATSSLSRIASFIVDSLAVSLAAIMATCPVIAYHFGIISFVGLPATFFALLSLPGVIVSAGLVSIFGPTIPILSQLLSWIAWCFLTFFVSAVQMYNAIPFSYTSLAQVHIWQVLVYYVLLAAFVMAIKHRKKVAAVVSRAVLRIKALGNQLMQVPTIFMKWVTICLFLGNAIIWTMVATMPDNKLHVSVLDVGQGDAILIQTPNGQNILIDGGPDPETIKLQLGRKIPFWHKKIDLVVLTQPQADHLTGLIEVVQKYEITNILESGISSDTVTYQEWLKTIRSKGIKREIIHAGQEIAIGDNITLKILHPPSAKALETANPIDDNGVVLRLSWNKISFLFTADISKETEWFLITQRKDLQSTVLKVAHHGSKTATSTEFLSVVDPEVAVISVAANNRFGHPHREILDRLATKVGDGRVFLTSEHGTVEFISDGEHLWVKCGK